MHRLGRVAVAAVCAGLWLAAATGVAQAARARTSAVVGSGSIRSEAPAVSCSTPIRLYDGTSFTGASVSISQRGTWINLGPLNFDNRTSSFRVGACSVDMASAADGGGALYPTCHNPGCEESSMQPGWNNVISSVFLH